MGFDSSSTAIENIEEKAAIVRCKDSLWIP
jgi:hypothetical protein